MQIKHTSETRIYHIKADSHGQQAGKREAHIMFRLEVDGKWHHDNTQFGTACNPYNYADWMFLRAVANEIERIKADLNIDETIKKIKQESEA